MHNSFLCTEFLVGAFWHGSWGWRWRVWGETEQHPGGAGRACQGFVVVCPAAGTMPSCLGKGKGWKACRRRGQLVVCWIYTWQAVLSALEKSSVCEPFPSQSSVTTPVISALPCAPELGSHSFQWAVPWRCCSSSLSCSRAGLYLLLGT